MKEHELSSQQLEVVNCKDKRIVCVAGAGSGKTTCLLHRIQRLESDGVDPTSMLVLTFTRNAAADMKLRYLQGPDSNENCPEFRTFHSFCYNLLCNDPIILQRLGYSSPPEIADEATEKKLDQSAKLLSGVTNVSKLMNKSHLSLKERQELTTYRSHINRLLHKNNLITYDSLSNYICELFSCHDSVIQKYLEKYRYVFVDEFQDTDEIQWNFVKSFTDSDIYVCGDALQNLYSFRGTTNEILKSLIDNETWTTLKLTDNYRSFDDIVNFANENSIYAKPEYRIEMTSNKPGGEISIEPLDRRKSLHGTLQDSETNYITNQLSYDIRLHPGTFALLARTNVEVNCIKSLLQQSSIDYQETGHNSDTPYYIQSVYDDNFFLNWVASYLNTQEYAKFLCLEYQQYDENNWHYLSDFYYTFRGYNEIDYKFQVIGELKNLIEDDLKPLEEKIQEVLKLLNLQIQIPEDHRSTINDVLNYIADHYEDETGSQVYVGTIHSVKGLEFDSVVMFGVNDSSFKLCNEENNNLYYVGSTRAKNYLKVFKYEERDES